MAKKGRKYPLKEQVSDLKALLKNRDAANETYEKQIEKLKHGGARKGSGRKKGEPTVVIRVRVSKLDEIKKINQS